MLRWPMELEEVAPEEGVEARQLRAVAVLLEVVGVIQARAILLKVTYLRVTQARVARNDTERNVSVELQSRLPCTLTVFTYCCVDIYVP